MAHHHHGPATADRRRLTIALALIVGFMAVEVVVGILASSLALLSDAAHMLTDAGAIALALGAARLADRPAGGGFTFGLKRAEILSAQLNGATLLALAAVIVVEGIRRLFDPPAVEGAAVLVVAVAGIAVNLAAIWTLSRADRRSLNVEGAFQHVLTDLFAFVATAVAGAVILATDYARADGIAALLVAGLMLRSGWGLLRDSGRVLLEASPRHLDPDEIGHTLAAQDHVVEVHDLHVWEVTSGFPSLSAHVTVRSGCDTQSHRRQLAELLHERFGIEHTTLQVETRPEGPLEIEPLRLSSTVSLPPRTGQPERTMMNRLREIQALGQAVWIDNLNRELLDEGVLGRLVEEDGISGVTSNPTIFEKGMGHSDRYDDAFREAAADTGDPQEIFERLAYRDVRDAADLLRPVFESTEGQDGYVSFELPAALAFDAEGSIEAAEHHRGAIDRPNVLIKVPGTEPGVRAFEELTARGVNVNVTLLFAVERHRDIAEAYLRGLERRLDSGAPIDRSASVASFFVSRVDTKVDAALEGSGREELRGRAAVANAKLAYAAFREIFAGERWDRLRAAGAGVQRPLWGSTSTKNPDYPDTLYVDELIGPDTVNTMPDATIEAARDHATPARTVDRDVEAARGLMEELRDAGVDLDDIVLRQLVDEGVRAFADSYDSLLETLSRKADRLASPAS